MESFLLSTLKVPSSVPYQQIWRGCCQPFFCGSSSCNKQDTFFGQCSQETDPCLFIPGEFIWGTVARALSTIMVKMHKSCSKLEETHNAAGILSSLSNNASDLTPRCKSSVALTRCKEQRGATISGVFNFTVKVVEPNMPVKILLLKK